MKESHLAKIAGQPCRMCQRGGCELHHLIPRSRWGKRTRHLMNELDNCIPLCHSCHQNHHTTGHRRVQRGVLSSSELRFMRDHIHEGWIDKWYPKEDT